MFFKKTFCNFANDSEKNRKEMLTPYKISDYCNEYKPDWACEMPAGCPPENIMVPIEHPFFRLAMRADSYSENDFISYAETDPLRNWGYRLVADRQCG